MKVMEMGRERWQLSTPEFIVFYNFLKYANSLVTYLYKQMTMVMNITNNNSSNTTQTMIPAKAPVKTDEQIDLSFVSQGRVRTAVRNSGQFCCSFVENLLKYLCAQNYENIMRFGKVIAKIIRVQFFFASQCTLLQGNRMF